MVILLPGTDKIDILSMEPHELEARIGEMGEKPFRARQLFKRLHRYSGGFEDFTELSKPLRERLAAGYEIARARVAKKQLSADGTVKYLMELPDKSLVECVLMRYKHGNTLCVSTQVGCRMGCVFCASGICGLSRNLTPSEMLAQVAAAQADSGLRVGGIVMMGTGEPLDNYEASVCFIRLVSHPDSFNIGQRHISLSTSGLADKIDELAELSLGITLSVSLHAPDDETRQRLMPVNKKWGVERLVEAAGAYQKKTGRRVSYEYALIRGVNDSPAQAEALAALLAGRGAHINLITLNEVEESPLRPAAPERAAAFAAALCARGMNVTVRRRLGRDIDGACGQLRRRAEPGL